MIEQLFLEVYSFLWIFSRSVSFCH